MRQHARGLAQLFGTPAERLMPLGIRFGRTIYAPNLTGTDANTGELVDGLEPQMEHALDRLGDVLVEADASAGNVARVTAYVGKVADRDPVYGPWDRLFPEPHDRPAFKVLVAPLPDGVRVRLDMLAVCGARRERIDIQGVAARDPTVKIGNWLATSRVHGTDPRTGQLSQGLGAEIERALENVGTLVELAGASRGNLAQLIVFVREAGTGQHAIQRARRLFPELGPAQLTVLKNFIPPSMSVMVEGFAARGGESMREVFTHPDLTPIPDAVFIGDLLFAPALVGEGTDFETQLRGALDAMQACLARAQLTLGDVGQVGVYMRDLNWKPTLNQVWTELFPDPGGRPPHKYVPLDGGDPKRLVQLQVFGMRGARRRILEIPGLVHGDPMSMGARVGDLVFSSRVVGTDTATGLTPPDAETQARLAFLNVKTLLERAGSSPADLTHVNAFINDATGYAATLKTWRELFPELSGALNLHFLNARLPGSTLVRLEVVAEC